MEYDSKTACPACEGFKKMDLAFNDMGSLWDPMDKREDVLLWCAWDATSISLKPAPAGHLYRQEPGLLADAATNAYLCQHVQEADFEILSIAFFWLMLLWS